MPPTEPAPHQNVNSPSKNPTRYPSGSCHIIRNGFILKRRFSQMLPYKMQIGYLVYFQDPYNVAVIHSGKQSGERQFRFTTSPPLVFGENPTYTRGLLYKFHPDLPEEIV